MSRPTLNSLRSPFALAAALCVLAAFTVTCGGDDEVGPDADAGGDVPADATPDVFDDEASGDVTDAVEEVETCEYPSTPHAIALRSTMPPIVWTDAPAGTAEEQIDAALEEIRCLPGVNSIFIIIDKLVCPVCDLRMNQIDDLTSHWNDTGAKWIFIVGDNEMPTISEANSYVNRHGVDFGWRTNDQDNSLGANGFLDEANFSAQPWLAVIRTSDMHMVCDEYFGSLDIEQVATDLSVGRTTNCPRDSSWAE